MPLAANTIAGCDAQRPATEIDDCETLAIQGGLTLSQFLTYNPSVKADCSGLKAGQAYCVHVPASKAPKAADLVKPLPPAPKAVAQGGKKLGAPANCQQWQKIFPADVKNKKRSCDYVAVLWSGLQGVPKAGAGAWLRSLNTELKEDCSNIEVDTHLCVRAPLQTGKTA